MLIVTNFPRRARFGINLAADVDYSFRQVNGFYSTQINYLIKMLLDKKVNPYLKQTLRKYIVITLFAGLEYFFKNEASNLVDKLNLDVSSFFVKSNLDKLVMDKGTTKGNIIASTYSFVNIDEIDFVFSNLLRLSSFLDYIVKLNVTDQTRFVLDGHPLPIEYDKFRKAYNLRNKIAHGIKDVKLSNSMVIHLWDNFLNIIDISVSIISSFLKPDENWNLQNSYEYGLSWVRIRGSFKLFSDKIFSKLIEKGFLEVPEDLYVLAKELKSSTCVEISEERIPRIIPKMVRAGVVYGSGTRIFLTPKGEMRYKRTTNTQRNVWKRESYRIICTWIPI